MNSLPFHPTILVYITEDCFSAVTKMFILVIKNFSDLQRVMRRTDELAICKLIKPYTKPRNHTEELFSNPEFGFIINHTEIDGVESVRYADSLSRRIEFQKKDFWTL